MTYWRGFRWSAAKVFLPLIFLAAFAGAASEEEFFGDYRLVAIRQAWVLLVVVGPLFAAWAAWDAARLRPWLAATFGGVFRPKAIARVLAPAQLVSALVVVGIVTWIAGRPEGSSSWLVTATAIATLVAVSILGAALGMVASRLIAAPVAIALTYAALAYAIADPSRWPARSILTGLAAPCCEQSSEIGSRSISNALILCGIVIVGGCLTLALQYGALTRAIVLVGFLALAASSAWILGKELPPMGQLVSRTTPLLCHEKNSRSVCVWPEHASELGMAQSTIEEVETRAIQPLGVTLPTRWSESPQKNEIYFKWASGLSGSEHKYALSVDVAHAVGCVTPDREAQMAVYLALHAGVSREDLRNRDPSLVEVADQLSRLSEASQRARMVSLIDRCQK